MRFALSSNKETTTAPSAIFTARILTAQSLRAPYHQGRHPHALPNPLSSHLKVLHPHGRALMLPDPFQAHKRPRVPQREDWTRLTPSLVGRQTPRIRLARSNLPHEVLLRLLHRRPYPGALCRRYRALGHVLELSHIINIPVMFSLVICFIFFSSLS